MAHWSAGDDKPYLRPEHSSRGAWWIVLVFVLAAAAAGYYYWTQRPRPAPPPAPAPAPVRPAPAPAKPAPAIQHPVAPPPPGAPPLPALGASDGSVGQALAKLVGESAFARLFYPDRIILRIVATIDSLPRKTAPENMMPVKPVPGKFAIAGTEGHLVIAPQNAARYTPYVRVVQAIDARALVDLYVRLYPLFQAAYVELGYPHGYFNDRLIVAIDNLLAAPDIKGPIKLTRPKVLYQFADPALENLSAGQKIMLRMGSANEAIVKVKLREIRQALLAHAPKQEKPHTP